jgi:tetratricopeptide (TPR) repeat protein
MKKLRRIFVPALTFVFAINLFAMSVDQPFMESAKVNLDQAKNNLNKATSDKGGHRNKAKSLVNQALKEVNKGIRYDRRNGNENFTTDEVYPDSGSNSPDQPFMEKAKKDLEQALSNLKNATSDKGGHRNKAIDLVKEAIDEVEKGIKYDRRN